MWNKGRNWAPSGTNADRMTDHGSPGLYMADGKRRIDYVLIYEKDKDHKPEQKDGKRKGKEKSNPVARVQYFLSNLVNAGVNVELEEDERDDGLVTLVKLHVTWDALCREAEKQRMRMPLKLRDPYEETANESAWKNFWSLKFLRPDDDDTNTANGHIFWPFDRDRPDRFLIPANRDQFFAPIQRSEIAWHIMQDCGNDPHERSSRGVEGLLEEDVLERAYPLHQGDYTIPSGLARSSYSPRQTLHAGWATGRVLFKPQPINRIRNYFGEKVAFYFAFTQFYTHSLLFPSLFGLIAFLYGLISVETNVKPVIDDICNEHGKVGQFDMCPICQPSTCSPFKMYEEGCDRSKWQYRLDNEATLIVSVLTVLWCALFLKYWRRRQARLAVQWQTYDMYQVHTVIRPDYEERATMERVDGVTSELEPHVPTAHRARRMAVSLAITGLLLAAAGACLTGLIAVRMALYQGFKKIGVKKNVEAARWMAHLLMYIMVTLFEKVYHAIVEKLTIMECPKTDSQFYRSLLWKTFIFAELVDFLPIAYAAWVKGRSVRTPLDLTSMTETCEPGGCMAEVVELVAVLLLFRLVLGNILEFAVPTIKGILKRRKERAHLKAKGWSKQQDWPQWIKDYHLEEMELDGISNELMEMMIQMSFVVFFVPALTLAPLVCFINNIIEIRVDASKFLSTHRRPTPSRVPNLEIWNTFLDIILKLGVLINAGLIAFTSEIIPRLYYKYRVPQSNGTFVGYPRFSMSALNVSHWPALQQLVHEVQESLAHHPEEDEAWIANMTECRYFDHREMDRPYAKTMRYWQVISYRIAAFALFAIGFYVVIYLINSLIKDVPSDVEKKIKRHQYVMTKHLEEYERGQTSASRTGGTPMGGVRRLRRVDNEPGAINRVYVGDDE